MHKGQLAKLPAADGRRAERRIVNLAASLREPGACVEDAEVLNLSTDGFMAETAMPLEIGTNIYLKLPGLEAQKCQVMWMEGGKAGFHFAEPLHPALIEQLTGNERKAPPKNHFGARRFG